MEDGGRPPAAATSPVTVTPQANPPAACSQPRSHRGRGRGPALCSAAAPRPPTAAPQRRAPLPPTVPQMQLAEAPCSPPDAAQASPQPTPPPPTLPAVRPRPSRPQRPSGVPEGADARGGGECGIRPWLRCAPRKPPGLPADRSPGARRPRRASARLPPGRGTCSCARPGWWPPAPAPCPHFLT